MIKATINIDHMSYSGHEEGGREEEEKDRSKLLLLSLISLFMMFNMLQENDPESKRRKTNPEEQEVFTVTGTWKKLNDFIRKKVEVNNESVERSPWRFLKKKMQTAKKKRNHLFFIDIGILRFSLLHHILSFLRVDFCICVQIEYQCVFFVRKNICFSGCIQEIEYKFYSLCYCLDFDLIRYEI